MGFSSRFDHPAQLRTQARHSRLRRVCGACRAWKHSANKGIGFQEKLVVERKLREAAERGEEPRIPKGTLSEPCASPCCLESWRLHPRLHPRTTAAMQGSGQAAGDLARGPQMALWVL